MDIASPITAVKGIGEKTQKAFAKMGVYTVGDILLHFPRDYVKFPEITDIDELNNVNVSSTCSEKYSENADYIAGYRLARAYDTAGMVPYAIP